MNNKILLFGFVNILLLLTSCNKKETDENKIILLIDKKNSSIELKDMVFDKIEVIKDDTLTFSRYYDYGHGEELLLSVFFKQDNNLYEKRDRIWLTFEIPEIDSIPNYKIPEIDSILTFSLKDTSFIYKSVFEIPLLIPSLGVADCKYDIFKQEDYYVTVKQSLIDTTYREIFYYDKDFNIFKFINTYQNNICIYK